MKRWLPAAILIVLSACATPPTPLPPTSVLSTPFVATVVPIPTLLPTVTVAATPAPVTATIEPTATRRPASSSVNTKPALKYPAPQAISPLADGHFNDGNDIKFVYTSVGALKPNECYLFHVELVNPDVNPGNRGDDFLDTDSCGDAGPAGKELEFVLYRGKFTNSPNYGTILQQATALAPQVRLMKMTWTSRVVQNNGRAADGVHYNTGALSPNSPLVEFDFSP